MAQFKALYLPHGFFNVYKTQILDTNEELTRKLQGLLDSVSTFEIVSNFVELPKEAPSIFHVALNIITRGTPTLPPLKVEDEITRLYGVTRIVEKNGSYVGESEIKAESLFEALHFIEPRTNGEDKNRYLSKRGLESSFEKRFLEDIPQEYDFLHQLFQRQRERRSINRDEKNEGRVDFSLEVPYNYLGNKSDKFNNNIQLKQHLIYIIEIDGKQYHIDKIDDLKDFEINTFSNNTSHITEESYEKDFHNLFNKIIQNDFIKLIKSNYVKGSDYLNDPIVGCLYTTINTSRLQVALLMYLSNNIDRDSINIAIIERDFPCAYIAIDNLLELLNNINELSGNKIKLPNISFDVFVSDHFYHRFLYKNEKYNSIEFLQHGANYDHVFDISSLIRYGNLKQDEQFKSFPSTSTLIRSTHYSDYRTKNLIRTSNVIVYQPIVDQLPNDQFIENETNVNYLRYFLKNIFRKKDFRDGQLPILNRALQNKSVIGLLPTGGGKSITYQLASILQPGITIIVDPIKSLMIDQVRGLNDIGIDKCQFLNSKLEANVKRYYQYLMPKGEIQFIFVSPERFVIEDFVTTIKECIEKHVFFAYGVIDEVHCVSEWGHDFRTSYLSLGTSIQKICRTKNDQSVPLIGLTATASFDVLTDIERELNINENDGNAIVRFENSIRDEINYEVIDCHVVVENLDSLNENGIKAAISEIKSKMLFEIYNKKDEIFNTIYSDIHIESVLNHTYNNFLSDDNRMKKNIKEFVNSKLSILKNDVPIFHQDNLLYSYGILVFMPHKNSVFGVNHLKKILVDKYRDIESIGTFVGSGDEDDSKQIEEESFKNLDYFSQNKHSIMVATKAFGMGIDKPNVRLTVHYSVPSSIESFVQEAGRAGRDKKISKSIILFNDQKLLYKSKGKISVEEDILMYFHNNSFKGKIKEETILYEFKNKIFFPSISKLNLLQRELNEQFNIKVKLNIHKKKTLYINDIIGNSKGSIDLLNICSNKNKSNNEINFLINKICDLFPNIYGQELANKLHYEEEDPSTEEGIEYVLKTLDINEEKKLIIPFTNKYYSNPKKKNSTNNQENFVLNENHKEKFENIFKECLPSVFFDISKFSSAVENGTSFEEYFKSLNIDDYLNKVSIDDRIKLQRAYYINRSADDTSKAIYRLLSIGIISDYTINYQDKYYKVTVKNHASGTYFNNLENLMAKYTSTNMAANKISGLKTKWEKDIKDGKTTEIQVCLTFLTDFVYDKIKAKRLQAIDDIINLCRDSVKITDVLAQNIFIKDQIFYYFNAKYSRRGFKEYIKGKEIEASMPDDYDNHLATEKIITKYIGLVGNEETGEFRSNLKHLRGSSMRMLSSYPNSAAFRVLKAYAMYIQMDELQQPYAEANREMIKGLLDWQERRFQENFLLSFLDSFTNKIQEHIKLINLNDVRIEIVSLYYLEYYTKFAQTINTILEG